MSSNPSEGMFTNSGILTARFAAVAFSIRTGGLSSPDSSMCVRNIWVYGDRLFDEKTSQRPFGEKLCQEFMSGVLQFMRRAVPPVAGTMKSFPSGRMSSPLRACTKTIQRPSGEIFGKELLIPFCEAPAIGSGVPPFPPLNGMRYRSYLI